MLLPLVCLLFPAWVACLNTLPKDSVVFKHPQQAEFIKSLTDYEIVAPSLVDRNGAFVSHDLSAGHWAATGPGGRRTARDSARRGPGPGPGPRRSRRRSGPSSAAWPEETPPETSTGARGPASPSTVHCRLSVSGEDLQLDLRPSRGLLAPGFVAERRGRNVSEARLMSRAGPGKQCHFNGRVRGHEGSKVAVSTCDGMLGLIRVRDEEFFIEPVKNHSAGRGSKRPHVVYRRSALPEYGRNRDKRDTATADKDNAKDKNDFCGVQDRVVEEGGVEDAPTRRTRHRSDTKAGKGRRRRSSSMERNVELLVVVDKHMLDYHRDQDIETYVLTIINIVATLYHDVSIGNHINIVMVRMLFLEEDEEGLSIEHDADKTLSSFCSWQESINPIGDDHPNHHDAAILLTRKDLCKGYDAPCRTLGLAQVSGMCQSDWSCNVNEDTGLALAYTVAHELGHSFGMQHDGLDNACSRANDSQVHVMSSKLTGIYESLTWSACSRNYITLFLDQGFGDCLNDEPSRHHFNYPLVPAGVMYTADHQCRLQYGVNTSVCLELETDICSSLWCKAGNRCHSKLSAAAQGTSCGRDKWCNGGECVDISEPAAAIHGDWGEWGAWTPCSFTCGSGVAIKERHCDNPRPANGGRFCIGERKKYAICNRQECPKGSVPPRERQCSRYNGSPYNGIYFQWEPHYSEKALCELHCLPKEKRYMLPIKFASKVEDGTPCMADSRDLCIGGICYSIGCDYQINSGAVEDRCGVCHGDGSSCETIRDQLIKQSGFGYVEAMVIPVGARNIRVEEVAEANNFLALMDPSGHYYLNGGWNIKWSGEYKAAGTVVRYERDDKDKERFDAKGPLKEPLHVMLLFQSKTAGVAYEYTVPKPGNGTALVPKHFQWVIAGWSPCTATCGMGLQREIIQCLERIAGIVEDKYCNGTKPAAGQRQCNSHQCPANWWIGPWQHCSVTCGAGGRRSRSVFCIRSIGQDEQVALVDGDCLRLGLTKPATAEGCGVAAPCPLKAEWVTGEWSECLYKNGRTEQTRTVHCSRTDAFCDYTSRPPTRQPCDYYYDSYDYYSTYSSATDETPISFGEWERLKQQGLLGERERDRGRATAPSMPEQRSPLPAANSIEDYGGPGHPDQGSEVAGRGGDDLILGVQVGQVDPDGDWVEPAGRGRSAWTTPEADPPSPTAGVALRTEKAGPVSDETSLWWFTRPWSQCSVSCGEGIRYRIVQCLEVDTGLVHGGCDQTARPRVSESCRLADCNSNSTSVPRSCDGNKQRNGWCQVVKIMGNCHKDIYREKCCATCT